MVDSKKIYEWQICAICGTGKIARIRVASKLLSKDPSSSSSSVYFQMSKKIQRFEAKVFDKKFTLCRKKLPNKFQKNMYIAWTIVLQSSKNLQRFFKLTKNLCLWSIFRIRRIFIFVFGPFSIFDATMARIIQIQS